MRGAFDLVFRDRYLLLIALMVLVYNLVNTTGEYILSRTVTAAAASAGSAAARARVIGAFYGDFFSWVNVVSAAMQLVFVPIVIRRFGARRSLFGLPVVALAGYTALALVPILAVVKGIKIVENSTDYSLQNTARQSLFLRVGRSAKYKAKAAIDSVFVRSGDVVSAGVVFCGVHAGLAPAGFALVNVMFVGVWLALVVAIARRSEPVRGADEQPEAREPRAVGESFGAEPEQDF